MKYVSDSADLIDRLKFVNRHNRVDTYLKATANLSQPEQERYNDSQIMDFMHGAMHQIEDHAGQHFGHQQKIREHHAHVDRLSGEQGKMKQKIKATLEMLAKNYSGVKLNSPSLSPHVFHIAEHHGVTPGVLRKLLSGKIDLDGAVDMIVDDIQFHKHHDPEDISSKMYNKSLCEVYKKGVDNIINVGLSGNALSMYRPSPPLFVDQFQKPDAEFIKILIKNNQYNSLANDRAVEPDEKRAVRELMDKIGIPEVREKDFEEESPQQNPRQLLQQLAKGGNDG